MLLTVARNYEEDVAGWADSLTALLSPLMLIVMGVVVGLIILAVILPMLDMIQTMNIG